MALKKIIKKSAAAVLAVSMTASVALGASAEDIANGFVTMDDEGYVIDLSGLDDVVDKLDEYLASAEKPEVQGASEDVLEFFADVNAAYNATVLDAFEEVLSGAGNDITGTVFDCKDKSLDYSFEIVIDGETLSLTGDYDKDENKLNALITLPEGAGTMSASLQYKDDLLTIEAPELLGYTVKVKISEKVLESMKSNSLSSMFDFSSLLNLFEYNVTEVAGTKLYTVTLPWETVQDGVSSALSLFSLYASMIGVDETELESMTAAFEQIPAVIEQFASFEGSDPKAVFAIKDGLLLSAYIGTEIKPEDQVLLGTSVTETFTKGVPEVLAGAYAAYNVSGGLTMTVTSNATVQDQSETQEMSCAFAAGRSNESSRFDYLVPVETYVLDFACILESGKITAIGTVMDTESDQTAEICKLVAHDMVLTENERSGSVDMTVQGETATFNFSVVAK